ncbi:hypothetical protein EV421DRAFT_2011953 [Armillaria borealis]|uniref:Uncharacterized protein n=1 Tax=Armillaria borealis TaxID=47425 RepID=A0AA39IW05_9AGAR|nr:hypothetical protein EV421DRAFT_2011953 [Armillaria borealis]
MKQGVLLPYRVRLLLSDRHFRYRARRMETPGLTDTILPKRAANIRKMFNLSKEDDVRKKKENAKPYTKAPKIEHLVTPIRLQRRRHLRSVKRRKLEHQKEQKSDALIAKRVSEKKAKAGAIKASHHKTTTA